MKNSNDKGMREEKYQETKDKTWRVESKAGKKPTYYKFCKICGQWL